MSVSKEVIKVLDAIGEKFGIAVDWTAENIMPYLTELSTKFVSYEVVTSIIWGLIGLILIMIGLFLIKPFKENYRKSMDEEHYSHSDRQIYDDTAGTCMIIMIVAIAIGTVIFFVQLFDVVTCFTLPEKVIIEEITNVYNSIK